MADEVEKQANLAGAMICVRVDKATADQLAVVGGEPPDRMHITLAHLGQAVELPPEADDSITEVLTEVAGRHPRLKAQLSGIGRFENTETGEDAVVALVDAPGLGALRLDLVSALESAGIPVKTDHDFTPHITIAYIGFHEQLPVGRIGELDMRIGALEYVQGDVRIARTPLKGAKKSVDSGALDDGGKLYPAGLDDEVDKVIRQQGGQWCVFSEDGGRNFGCYDTKTEAEARLRQIHTFSDKTEDEAVLTKTAYEYDITIQKTEEEQRLVYGIVLEPDEIDAQGDTISVEGIQTTAHNFLAKYNRESEMGHMHQRLGDIGVDLVESFIAPMSFTWGSQPVKKGSWIIGVKVHDDQLWNDVKTKKLTGFSVAGIATIRES